MKARVAGWQLAVRALCAIALTFAAFAHRPALPGPSGVDLAQYVLPDGTIPVICTTGGDGRPLHPGSGDCEFCRIAASVAVPDAPTDFQSCAVALKLDFGRPADDEFVRPAFFAHAPPRGPPAGNPNA